MDLLIYGLGSFFLFLHKIFLAKRHKNVWMIGLLGTTLMTWPIYQQHFKVSLVAQGGSFFLAMYGHFVRNRSDLISPVTAFRLRIAFSFLIMAACFYIFFETPPFQNHREVQLVQSITGLIGSLFLAMHLRKSNIAGWIMYIASHIACICLFGAKFMLLYEVKYLIILIFQCISVPVAFWGIKKEYFREYEKKEEETAPA